MKTISDFASKIIDFINNVGVPLVFAIAFIVFIYGIFQYFILGAASEEKRKTGRQFAVYGIVGFFVMISVWGLVNLVLGTFGLSSQARPCLPTFTNDPNCSGSQTTTGTQTTPTQTSPVTTPNPTSPTSPFIGPVD